MIALLPLLFGNNLEIQFWQNNGAGREYLLWLLREIESLVQIDKILVLALEPGWEYLKSDNVTVLQISHDLFLNENHQSIITLFFNKKLLEVISPYLPSQDCKLLCVDIRNPSLNLSLLEQALCCDQKTELPMLVSVREVTDHPCQCQTYSQVIDAGIIHFLEPAKQDSKQLSTKPFPLYPGDSIYIKKISKQTKKNNPTETKIDFMLGEDVQSCFGNRSPVGIFHRDIPRTGQSLDASILKYICIDSEGLLHVRFPQDNGQMATHVAVQPFQSRDFALVTPKLVSLSSNQVDNIEIALDLDITDLNGLIYTIFQDVIGGQYDTSNNIKPIQGLWSYDENGIAINSSNGRKILGRQDFPPIFEVENSIIVIEAARLHDIQAILNSGQAFGFLVKQSQITINTKNDVILAKAMIHMASQSHNILS